ncbi:polysaccharide biosynthesis tyrosine autokinase [Neiella marina]|uniref:non-specific protein-tyrosine kinase n=1 Tax=Neiella holothuriorum TaxID=2870530 RepID=A0ABS7EB23_9GAMM|nr:polysaccharide biosynthesis tyrosine autokinase [Neiella holothuriorum]MBW8189404.1 polysaccharide biosynthesis tyrosine autokinase [Neiella holothuriorum]
MNSYSSAPNHQNDSELLVDLVTLLWRKRLLIIAVATVFALLAVIYVKSLALMYRTSANVQIGGQKSNVVAIEQLYVIDERSSSHMSTQVELLKSRAIAQKVIAQMSLHTHPEFTYRQPSVFEYWRGYFTGKESLMSQLEWPVTTQWLEAEFRARLSVAPVRDSEIIQISFDAYDPKLAAGVANGIVAAYIDYHRDSQSEMTEQTSQWLLEQLEEQRANLLRAEQELSAFRKTEDLIDISGILGLVSQELNQTSSQIIEARRKSEEISVLSGLVQEYSKNDVMDLLAIESVREHPSIKSIRDKRLELRLRESELAKRYGPKHPKRTALAAEQKAVDDNLTELLTQISSTMANEYQAAQLKERGLENAFERTKATYQRLSNVQAKFTQLQREVETHQKLYDTFLTRFEETKATEDLEHNYARLIDPAIVPIYPFKPRKVMILMIAVVLGGMLGCLIVFARSLLGGAIRKGAEVETSLGLDVLIELPVVKLKKRSPVQALLEDSYFSEAIHGLRTRLQLSGGRNQLAAITSTLPGEGKSSVAIQLAISCGEIEKVLLIDADMRSPSINTMLDIEPTMPGLSNVLSRSHKVGACIHHSSELDIDVMPAGKPTSDPLNYLSSNKFKVLINGLREHYDRIIIETGPIQAVSDAQVVSTVADKLLYVVKAEQTSRAGVKAGLDRLRKVNAPILGIVLNQVPVRRSGTSQKWGQQTEFAPNLVELSQARANRNRA